MSAHKSNVRKACVRKVLHIDIQMAFTQAAGLEIPLGADRRPGCQRFSRSPSGCPNTQSPAYQRPPVHLIHNNHHVIPSPIHLNPLP